MILLALACRPPERPDVVLITLDTTRADRVGAYGAPDARTPEIDALAAGGTRFDRAISPIPLTVPAHASLLTGRYPPGHGIRANGDATLAPGLVTLAERLHGEGYATAAAVGAFVTSRAFGFDQGFDTFSDRMEGGGERPAEAVAADVLAWEARTRAGRAPRFAWVHLYDAHLPWVGSYEDELARADAAVGAVVAAFDRRPTLFVVAGDHGESLGEHGEDAHGLFVYDATQRVPLVMAGPGVPAGEVHAEPVSLVDVAPTVLALLGLPPLPRADGRAWPSPPRPLYAESWQLAQRFALAPHVAVVDGPLVLVDLPRPELYDTARDPMQGTDLALGRPADVERLRAALAGMAFDPPAPAALDPLVERQLAALGYVVGAEPATDARTDPKDAADLLSGSQRADALALAGRWAEAEAELARLEAAHPQLADLSARRAWMLLRAGRLDEAIRVSTDAVARDPTDPTLRVALASRLASEKRFAEAAELYRGAAEAAPWMPRARALALRALLDAGDAAGAAELGLSWRQDHPDDADVAGLAGLALVRLRRVPEAMPLLEAGALSPAPEAGVLYHLSAASAGRGDRAAATVWLDRELALHPAYGEALSARCAWHARAREHAAMRALAARALALAPDDPVALQCEAAGLLGQGDRPGARAALDRALAGAPDEPSLIALDAQLLHEEGRVDEARARREQARAAAAADARRRAPGP